MPVAPHEVDALVSFHYNTGAIARAALTRNLDTGDRAAAGATFMNWVRPASLRSRREAERDLFLYGRYPAGPIPVWAADADGRYTFVIAHEDPGVHNWLDTGGLHEVFALHRWQGLPRDLAVPPTITSRVVPLRELEHALPRGVRTVTAAERRDQFARRRREYQRRFAED